MNKQGKDGIPYCDYTWNPAVGCMHGCSYCYAEKIAHRFKGPAFPNGFKPTYHLSRLNEPDKLKKPSRIFVCDMADLFGDWVPRDFIVEVLSTVINNPQHTFLFLTKNPQRYKEFNFPDNAWIGTTVENQEAADMRIPHLLKAEAKVRFVSCEPLLGAVDLKQYIPVIVGHGQYHWDRGDLDWVIVGGQSGPGAKPMHPDWARGLRDQCQAAGVPFMFKQWGAWYPFYDRDKDDTDWRNIPEEKTGICRMNIDGGKGFHGDRLVYFKNVGKKKSGRMLDGRNWDEMPEGA